MKGYFITAIGTGIGKTLLTCALAYQLRARGVRALKPVASGFDAGDAGGSDTGLLLAAQGLPLSPEHVDAVSPWRFAAPLSPDMAAADEGRVVNFERLVAFCREKGDEAIRLVEGIGGVMTPLNETRTVLDWAAALGFPVIMVAGSYLGSLSHALTAIHAIHSAGLTLGAVVVSESDSSPAPMQRTLATLRGFLPPATRLEAISRLDSRPELWKYVPDLTHILTV